jgi:molecular chaperone HscC
MIVGIDLGTTNSLVGVWIDGRAQLIPNALKVNLTPSVVSVDEGGDILVGQAAVERMLTHPHLTASVFKRYMGTAKSLPLGKKHYRAEELSALVLRSLKRDAEEFTGEKVSEAVISVPAYFNNAQRNATRTAGELAGLKVERLINEPTAAALAYGLHQSKPESQFLVFDLGGGTFDVTILELFDGVMEVRSSAGDNFLGGEDFVELLIERFVHHGYSEGLKPKDLEQNPKLRQSLRREAELAKRRLTDSAETTMSVSMSGRVVEMRVTEEDLQTWAEPLLRRIRQPVETSLRDARILPSQLDQILLVGGATRMPIVRKLVARLFGRFPSTEIHPDEAVALGVAVQAGLKSRDAALNEVVLTDVCPYSLGVEFAQRSTTSQAIQAGFFQPVIERNNVIPTSRVESFSTLVDNQSYVEIRIYQGESRLVKDNIFLGKVQVKVPPKPAGKEPIEVRFTYDINGLLEVEAMVVSTGVKKSVVIEERPGVLSDSEVKERLAVLAALKIHPSDQLENRTLLARGDRLYEQSLGVVREQVGFETAQFSATLLTQDPLLVARARNHLSLFLDSVEWKSPLEPDPS